MFTDDELLEIGIPEGAHLEAIQLTSGLEALGFPLAFIETVFDGLVEHSQRPWYCLMDCEPHLRGPDAGLLQRLCHAINDAWEMPNPDALGRAIKK